MKIFRYATCSTPNSNRCVCQRSEDLLTFKMRMCSLPPSIFLIFHKCIFSFSRRSTDWPGPNASCEPLIVVLGTGIRTTTFVPELCVCVCVCVCVCACKSILVNPWASLPCTDLALSILPPLFALSSGVSTDSCRLCVVPMVQKVSFCRILVIPSSYSPCKGICVWCQWSILAKIFRSACLLVYMCNALQPVFWSESPICSIGTANTVNFVS